MLNTPSPAPAFGYRLLGEDGLARVGEITTLRGIIRTPAFMPVGTVATVKALYPEQVKAAGAEIHGEHEHDEERRQAEQPPAHASMVREGSRG